MMNENDLNLPPRWSLSSLGEIVIKKVEQGSPIEEIEYIEISSVNNKEKTIGELKKINKNNAPSRAKQWVKPGDVIISMTRPNLNAVAIVPEMKTAIASTGFDVLRSVIIPSKWIFYRVQSLSFINDVCKNLQGVVYPAIRPNDIKEHVLPIPPYCEIVRIIKLIESYYTRLEDVSSNLKKVQEKLRSFKASVLKAAVEGRLVQTEAELARQENREYEPASVLLEKILKERKKCWIEDKAEKARVTAEEKAKSLGKNWGTEDDEKTLAAELSKASNKYKEPPSPDTTDLPELPEGWCWVNIDQLLKSIDAGKSFRCFERPPIEPEVGVLKVSAVSWGFFNENESKTCPNASYVRKDYFVHEGDFLFSRANTIELVGACVIVRTIKKQLMLSDKTLRLNFIDGWNEWILYLLRSHYGRKQIQNLSTGNQDSMRNISQGNIRKIILPLPTEIDRVKILEKSETIISTVDFLSENINKKFKNIEKLEHSILKSAFEGKLVDQDPNDEPATVLLEKIKLEREKDTNPKKSKKPNNSKITNSKKSDQLDLFGTQ